MPAERPSWSGRLVITGAALTVVAFAGVGLSGGAAWRAWLGASYLMAGAPIGALALVMMLRIIPGKWGASLQGPSRGLAALTLPALAFLLPVLLRLDGIYPWVGAHQETSFRAAYFTETGFALRSFVWGGVFAVLAWLAAVRQAGGALAAGGLIAFVLLDNVAATDWLMSLDPAFNSSGFGLWIIAQQMLTALALSVVAACAGRRSVDGLGAVLLAALLIWLYLAFMHYMILWSGNLSPGAAWYQRRGHGVWWALIWVDTACRIVPAFLLFFSPLRRDRRTLGAIAVAAAAGSVLEIAWLVLPAADPAASGLGGGLYVLAVSGLGLLGAGAFLWLRPRLLLLPARALEEVVP